MFNICFDYSLIYPMRQTDRRFEKNKFSNFLFYLRQIADLPEYIFILPFPEALRA